MLRRNITRRVARAARAKGLIVLSHRGWGAKQTAVYAWRRKNKPHFLIPHQPVDTVWQHITVTNPETKFKDSRSNFIADCLEVERIGQERFGTGVSYNFLVDMTHGFVAIGQPLDAKGSHTVNDKGIPHYTFDQNGVAIAIAVVGNPNTRLSSRAETAIATLIRVLIQQGVVTEGFDYNPHSMVAAKDCPCDDTRDKMTRIRRTATR